MKTRSLTVLATTLFATGIACSFAAGPASTTASAPKTPPASAASPATTAATPLPAGFHRLSPDIIVGGQPSSADLEAFRKAGVSTIVNLRPDSEAGVADEETFIAILPFQYVQIPLTLDNVDAAKVDTFRRTIKDPSNRPMVVHCATGGRVGMMFAILAALDDGKSLQEAEEIGEAAGMTKEAVKKAFRDYMAKAKPGSKP